VPTREISMVWAADMLRPSQYKASPGTAWYEHQRSQLAEMQQRSWQRRSCHSRPTVNALVANAWWWEPPTEYTITSPRWEREWNAILRQRQFQSEVLNLGPRVLTPHWIEAAVARYVRFLELARDRPDELLVPALDIYLIWHAHMLSPDDYRADCAAVVGRLLTHNDDVAPGTRETSLMRTRAFWQQRHQQPYMQTGGSIVNSACGPCGSSLFPSRLASP